MYKEEYLSGSNLTIRTEEWCGYKIRFVIYKDQWMAVLKDVCDALNLRTDKVAQRLDTSLLDRLPIETSDHPSKVDRSRGENKTRWMLVVSEIGIYEALFASRKLEARKFRLWTAEVLQRLRGFVGLQGYEVMRMTDEEVQEQIDDILDVLYWDDERGELMISVTEEGGQPEQYPFEEYIKQQ